jgi:hypothetical protein
VILRVAAAISAALLAYSLRHDESDFMVLLLQVGGLGAVAGDLEVFRSFWRRLKAQGLGATAIAKALGIGRAIAY